MTRVTPGTALPARVMLSLDGSRSLFLTLETSHPRTGRPPPRHPTARERRSRWSTRSFVQHSGRLRCDVSGAKGGSREDPNRLSRAVLCEDRGLCRAPADRAHGRTDKTRFGGQQVDSEGLTERRNGCPSRAQDLTPREAAAAPDQDADGTRHASEGPDAPRRPVTCPSRRCGMFRIGSVGPWNLGEARRRSPEPAAFPRHPKALRALAGSLPRGGEVPAGPSESAYAGRREMHHELRRAALLDRHPSRERHTTDA